MRASTRHGIGQSHRGALRLAAALIAAPFCLPALLEPPDGALHAQQPSAPAEGPRRSAGFSIALMPTASITGTVTDPNGNPIAGASILVDLLDPGELGVSLDGAGTSYEGRAAYGMDNQARSESDGTFRLTGLDRDRPHLLTVEAPGFLRSATELASIGVSTDPIRVVLSRGRHARGKVVDTDGRPVEAASVLLVPAIRNPPGGTSLSYDSHLTATTDPEGTFEFPAVGAGSYQLAVDHAEFTFRTPRGIDIPEGEGDLDLGSTTLTPGWAIRGLVVGADRRPVAAAQVSAFQGYAVPGPAGEGSRSATTDADGRFRLGGLPQGRVDVTATADGYAESRARGVDPSADDLLEIELNRGATLAGRVVDTRGEAVSASVILFADPEPGAFSGSGLAEQAMTDADGRFRFEFLRPGTWRAHASAFAGGDAKSTPVHLRTGETREIELVLASHDAQVVGTVTNHLGEPLGEAEVTIVASGGVHPGSSWRTSADPRGRFESRHLPTGTGTIVASHPEYRETVREITIDPGSNEVPLVLEPGLEIGGAVRSADGRPVPLAAVSAEFDLAPDALQQAMNDPSIRERRGMPLRPVEALTDRNGEYRLAGLTEGTYKLTAWADGYGSGSAVGRRVRLRGGSAGGVDIVLPAQAAIEVRIAGQPLLGLNVGVRQGLSDYRTATPDGDGNYVIEGLGPGDWTVAAQQADGRSVQRTVDLQAGERTVVELRFEEGLRLTGRVTVAGHSPARGTIALLGEHAQPRWADLDRDGRFELGGVPAGAYTLLVGVAGAAGTNASANYSRRVELVGDRDLRIDLEAPAVLSGLVLDGEGQPLAGALVGTVEAGAGGPIPAGAILYTGAFGGTATTDIDGRFDLRSAPGAYDLQISREGFDTLIVPVELASAEYRQGLVFELRAGANRQL